ncbi:MAG: glycosyltransferase family 9 protein [Candidatus Neomarinimicrobiota bacterium]
MSSIKAILVLRFSSIGDIIQATSPVGTLRELYPGARIDFMTLSKFAPLLEGHPGLSRVLPLDINASGFELIKTGKYLDTLDYNLILDLHNSLRSKIIRFGIRKTKVLSVKKPRYKRLKLFHFHKNSFSGDFNVRTWLHEPLSSFSEKKNIHPTSLYVSPQEKESAREMLVSNGIGEDYFVITPGAAWFQKRWYGDKYAEIVNYCRRQFGFKAVILGGVNDHICDEIKNTANSALADFHGKTDLRESLAILAQAEFIIGSDTGFLHAGEALGVPVLTILGPTSIETGAGIFLEKSQAIFVKDLWCRPCSQNGSRPCYRQKRYCMTGISAENVKQGINTIQAA